MRNLNILRKALFVAVTLTISIFQCAMVLPEFPVDLRGSTPEEAAITVNAGKPADAGDAIISLATYDADFPDEGELIINDNQPIMLFGSAGVSGNDQNSTNISFRTPASYWQNGNNTLVFRHVNTTGFIIDAATVSFESAPGGSEAAGNDNTAPRISGSPATSVTVGNDYAFQPSANDADGDILTFSISNRPSWASFNTSTGRLSGTPDSAATTSNIRISVADDYTTVTLPAFAITVNDAAQQTGSVSLIWTPPVARADGSALAMSEIAGYTVHYGTSAGNYPNSLYVDGGSSTSTTITSLPVGTYYMVLTTGDSDGRESVHSSMVTKTVK